jgi:hypothetical protein
MDEFEDPPRSDIFGEKGEFGEGDGEQVVELVDLSGALPDAGLEPGGDLTQDAQSDGQRRRVGRPCLRM